MDIPWGSPEAKKFITNVGLITTRGPHGDNIASMEWSHQISYSPGLVMVNVHDWDATADNILASKEFGVNLAAFDQNVLASIAGGSTGKEVDKVGLLKELGFSFSPAEKIKTLMVDGSALQIECNLFESRKVGDHMMFIGDVVAVRLNGKEPLLYHDGKFFKIGEQLAKPEQKILDRIQKLKEEYAK